MKRNRKKIFAEIAKVEQQEDGTVKVWGYASTGAKDSDGETITPECMKNALPGYMKWGAVREMHQPSAAGTAIEASVGEDGKTWFGAHVVDTEAVKKVNAGVYKGFSVGGKVLERDPMDKTVIKGLDLYEVSLVDRPANPECAITVVKALTTPEDDVEELAELLDSGAVTPAQMVALAKAALEGKSDAPGTDSGAAGASSGASGAAQTDTASTGAQDGTGEDTTKAAATGSTGAPPQGGVPPEGTSAPADTVQKGMYNVSRFAEMVQSVAWMLMDVQAEADWEGDGSPLPAMLRDWLKAGAAIFKTMAEEEVNELLATAEATTAAKAAKPDIAKVGARFSKATKTALSAIHKACKEADGHLTSLKYEDEEEAEEDTAGKAAGTSDTNGIVPPNVEEIVTKAIAPLQGQLEKLGKENEELRKALGKMPAPGKALLKALSKAEDSASTNTGESTTETPPPEGTMERANWEMRKVYSGGAKHG